MQRLLFAVFAFSILLVCLQSQTTATPNYYCTKSGQTAQFTFSTGYHSTLNVALNCALSRCANGSNDSGGCSSLSTACFEYRSINNTIICAPAVLCSILEPCDNITHTCSSNSTTCVINSCCSPQAVCLPTGLASFCKTGWSSTGILNVARYWHTASVLTDGKVLVAGGLKLYSNTQILNSSEVYDPLIGSWIMTSSMNCERYMHTATVLQSSNVLVAGGNENTVEIYNSSTGVWMMVGFMNDARSSFTATMLSNGQVLAAGGNYFTHLFETAELYNPSTANWTRTANMTAARSHHTASFLANGQVLVAGGRYNNGNYTGTISCEVYDPISETWTPTGNMSIARFEHTASVLMNGHVLVTGGFFTSSAELYDPLAQTWTMTGNMSFVRYGHTASVLSNGKVLVTGGLSSKISEIYDPSIGQWSLLSSMSTSRLYNTASTLLNGRILVAGGHGGNMTPAELF